MAKLQPWKHYKVTPKAFAVKLAPSLLEFIGVDLA